MRLSHLPSFTQQGGESSAHAVFPILLTTVCTHCEKNFALFTHYLHCRLSKMFSQKEEITLEGSWDLAYIQADSRVFPEPKAPRYSNKTLSALCCLTPLPTALQGPELVGMCLKDKYVLISSQTFKTSCFLWCFISSVASLPRVKFVSTEEQSWRIEGESTTVFFSLTI